MKQQSAAVFAALDKSMLSAAKDLKLPVFRDGTYGDTQFSAALLAKDSRLIVHTSRDPLPAATTSPSSPPRNSPNPGVQAQPGKGRDAFAEAVLDCVAAILPAAGWDS
jgi:hypothetical protein